MIVFVLRLCVFLLRRSHICPPRGFNSFCLPKSCQMFQIFYLYEKRDLTIERDSSSKISEQTADC